MSEWEELLGTGSSEWEEKPCDPLAWSCWHDVTGDCGNETESWGGWRERRCLWSHLSSTITHSPVVLQLLEHDLSLTDTAQKGENDMGWHQPSSLSICHTLRLVPNRESKLSAEAPLIPLKIPHPKQAERELSSEGSPTHWASRRWTPGAVGLL